MKSITDIKCDKWVVRLCIINGVTNLQELEWLVKNKPTELMKWRNMGKKRLTVLQKLFKP